MLNPNEYIGSFSSYLTDFIDEKRHLGCAYIEEERLAHEFDKLSLEYDCSDGLLPELVNSFIKCKPNWQATTQKRHISFLTNFSRYLLNHDIQAFIPNCSSLNLGKTNFSPYIFSPDEIKTIFSLSDKIHPNCKNSHIFYPVLFRVLYCTGMRISEALKLKISDVDLIHKVICVVNPKNHKDRHLPISNSLADYLLWYRTKIHPILYDDSLFFQSNRGDGHYSRNNVQVFFSQIIFKMEIPTNGYKGGGPHLHCLRHSFCVHSLRQMLEDDIPHGVALQLLSAYMGHQSLSATAHYLRLTAESFPELMDMIEEIYSEVFPEIKGVKEIKMPYEENN